MVGMETFGQLLKELRRGKNVSQRDLAEKVDVDFSYISKIENDRLPPPAADTIVKICEVLDVPPDDLLAAAGKLPSEVKDMIGNNPAAMQFMRSAREMQLTESEWQSLTKRLKKLRS